MFELWQSWLVIIILNIMVKQQSYINIVTRLERTEVKLL